MSDGSTGGALTVAVAVVVAAACGCAVGEGEGEITGVVHIEDCGLDGQYSLRPSFFVAEGRDSWLEVRVQRGSDWEIYSDGLFMFVADAGRTRREQLGAALDLALDPAVQLTFYLNETCRAGRTGVPVALTAQSGTITFDSIYAPEAAPHDVETAAMLTNVYMVDARRPDERTAMLSGHFRFLYSRGRPAQRFP